MKSLLWLCTGALLLSSLASRGEPFAYFPDRDNGSVRVVDVATNQPVKTIAVGNQPVVATVPAVGHWAYVGNRGVPGSCVVPPPGGGGGGSVPPSVLPYLSVIDTGSQSVIAQVTLPVAPQYMQASADSATVYIVGLDPNVPCGASTIFAAYDTQSQQVLTSTFVQIAATGMAVDKARSRVYVANAAGEVDVIDTSTGDISARIPIGQIIFPSGMALDRLNGRLYVANLKSVTVIDTSTLSVIATLPTADNPSSLALDPSGSPLLIAEPFAYAVEVLDLALRKVTKSFSFNTAASVGMSPDGQEAYVLSGSGQPGTTNTATPIRMRDLSPLPGLSIGTAFADGQFIGALGSTPNQFPAALSGLWWDPSQSGWGLHLTQRGDTIFGVWFTYDEYGYPRWYIAPNCVPSPTSAVEMNCSSTLYQTHAPPVIGGPFDAALVRTTQAGVLQLQFQDNDHATYTFGLTGHLVGGAIQRQVFRTSPPAGTNYTDLWYNALEPGWGIGIVEQGDTMFLTWYIYDGAATPTWLFASNCAVKTDGNGCAGTLYRASGALGPMAGVAFDPSKVNVTAAGQVDVTFDGPNSGTIRYTVDGTSGTKVIVRQLF